MTLLRAIIQQYITYSPMEQARCYYFYRNNSPHKAVLLTRSARRIYCVSYYLFIKYNFCYNYLFSAYSYSGGAIGVYVAG
jgi:hypothetical protein